MSLIEDLSHPLSRLIVYLCLSLIGLKRELSPWSIQRRAKSNHFSICPFLVFVFLSSSFCYSLFVFSLFPCFTAKLFTSFFSLHFFFILVFFASPNCCFYFFFSFSVFLNYFFFIPCLFLYFVSGSLSPLSSLHFSTTAISHTSSQKQLVQTKEQLSLGKVNFARSFWQNDTKQLFQTHTSFSFHDKHDLQALQFQESMQYIFFMNCTPSLHFDNFCFFWLFKEKRKKTRREI